MDKVVFIFGRLARDRSAMFGCILILMLLFMALAAPWLATHPDDVWDLHLSERLLAPSFDHFFGTDRAGRDIYSRILFGTRITFFIALIAVSASILIGVPVGLLAGYYHTWFSDVLMRISDIFLAVPQIVLAILIANTLGPSIPNIILALSVTYWPWFTRLVYAETRSLQNEVFIEADHRHGRGTLARAVPTHPAEYILVDYRAGVYRHGLHHLDRRDPGLPWCRRATAKSGMGSYDLGIA